jgi:hypothetical protein
VDELNKMVKTLSAYMDKMKFEWKQGYKVAQNAEIRGNFRSRDRDDQKIQIPLQNNLMVDEEGEEEELDPEIHCLGDTSPFPHLTQSSYEKSLMYNQINELSKGEMTNNSPNKYNLRYKKREGKSDIPDQPSKVEKPTKDATNRNKENKS